MYFSHKLSPAEQNYYIGNRELLVGRVAALAGRSPSSIVGISYHPGAKKFKADSLSHLYSPEEPLEEPKTILSPEIILIPIQWSLDNHIMKAAKPAPPGCPANKTFVPTLQHIPFMESVHT